MYALITFDWPFLFLRRLTYVLLYARVRCARFNNCFVNFYSFNKRLNRTRLLTFFFFFHSCSAFIFHAFTNDKIVVQMRLTFIRLFVFVHTFGFKYVNVYNTYKTSPFFLLAYSHEIRKYNIDVFEFSFGNLFF